MKNKIKIFTILSGFLAVIFLLASCSGNNITGTLAITAKRTSIDVYAEFDDNDKVSSSSPYVNLYTVSSDGAETYSTQKTLAFESSVYSQTKTASFTNLKEETNYVLKLFVTVDNKAYEIDNQTITTTPAGSTEDDPIIITSYTELMDMDSDNSAFYKLDADIDCNGATIESLFTSSSKFSGSFDGNNHIISNFVLPSNTYMGLFAYASGATIKNLTLDTVSLASSLSSSGRGETYLGAVVGRADNTTIKNVHVINVDFDITFYSTASVSMGAFSGRLMDCTVTNCDVKGADINVLRARRQIVIGLFSGFLEGKTTVTTCFSEGIIKTVTNFSTTTGVDDYCFIGGFAGVSGSRGLVSDSYSKVTITITEDSTKTSVSDTHELAVGGFIGRNMQGIFNVDTCAAIADISVKTLHSANAYVGGIIGNVTNNACILKDTVYAPLDKGIEVNYTESTDDADGDTTEESTSSTSESTDSDVTKTVVNVGMVCGSSQQFNTDGIYVVGDLLKYDAATDTLVAFEYLTYTESAISFSEGILAKIASYINK